MCNLQQMRICRLWAIMQLGFQRHSQTINAVIFWAIQETLKSTWKTAANTNPQKRPICKKKDLWNCYRTWDAINCIDEKILFSYGSDNGAGLKSKRAWPFFLRLHADGTTLNQHFHPTTIFCKKLSWMEIPDYNLRTYFRKIQTYPLHFYFYATFDSGFKAISL